MSNDLGYQDKGPDTNPQTSYADGAAASTMVQSDEKYPATPGGKDTGINIYNNFNLAELVREIQNILGTPARPAAAGTPNDFALHNQALQGFVQSNVSKKEGFSLDVKVAPDFSKELERLIQERSKTEIEKNAFQ